MKRILILGSCGSGKSTLARQIGERLGVPVAHMDVLFWKPGWVETSDSELLPKIRKFIKGPAWVFDGNYTRSLALRLKRADTVVFLDLNKWVCRWRVIKRWMMWAGRQRPDIGPGCPEKMDWQFFMWVWNHDRAGALARISALRPKHKVHCLRNSAEVEAFLQSLPGRPR
jgi:adenylate kinase family enzyme